MPKRFGYLKRVKTYGRIGRLKPKGLKGLRQNKGDTLGCKGESRT